MLDSASFWVADDRGELGILRLFAEASAERWDTRLVSLNLGLPGGRTLVFHGQHPALPPSGPAGSNAVLGAGPLSFRCVEPFGVWTASFDGLAIDVAPLDRERRVYEGPHVHVALRIEATMAAPPWIQGQLSAQAAATLNSTQGRAMGGQRYEQLFRAEIELRVGDEGRRRLRGTGLRIRRQGVRRLDGFRGHAWQSALFSSGRGFGYIVYPPGPDGLEPYNEGFVLREDGTRTPARVLRAPWLGRYAHAGEDVSVVLETEAGSVEIGGESTFSFYGVARPQLSPDFPLVQQAGARYRWGDEEAFGMMERSSMIEAIRGLQG